MKAIILAAGLGSRIRPLTDNCPKCLLEIDGKPILEMMIHHIKECGINEIIFITGYLENKIIEYVKNNFPELKTHFISNEKYSETNSGFSLLLAKDFVIDSDFIKFDADVVFEKKILKKLIDSAHQNVLCIDKNIQLDQEEVKVLIDRKEKILKVNKNLAPEKAIGESIGIEKIGKHTAKILFEELGQMMKNKENYQAYYEAAYEKIIKKNSSFFALDITGLKWVEIDTKDDLNLAKTLNF